MSYPLQAGGVGDYPVRVGSMLLTMVDPHRGFEQAYNRWYERDHFYAGCLVGPYMLAGGRWVATAELKRRRWPAGATAVADPPEAGSYVATYWVEQDHHADWDAWALTQVRWLYGNGRGFTERTHVHTANYDAVGVSYRDADPVPLELALDHGYPALVVVWFDAPEGQPAAELHERLAAGPLPALLDATGPVATVSSWAPRPEFQGSRDAPMTLGSTGGGPGRLCQLMFVDGDLDAALPAVRAYTDRVTGDGLATTLLAAPFLRTVVGTDRYVDELW